MEKNLVRWKTLLGLAWPLIVANSFWNLQLTVDRVFLGKFSTEALGAALTVMGVFWVPMALLQQTASYITTFVAQYTGAHQSEKIGSCLWQAFYVSVIGGICFLCLNLFSSSFFAELGHAPNVTNLEIQYFNSLSYSALPTALVAAISGFYTGLGETKMVMKINFIGVFLNVILDYLFIFGNFGFPEMGIAGAGYATALATYGSVLYGAVHVFNSANQSNFRLRKDFQLQPKLMFQFLKFGLPSGLQWSLEGLAFTVFLTIMGQMQNGAVALSSSSIAVTIMMLAVLPSMGVAQAVLTKVGQFLGEDKSDDAVTVTWDGVKVSLIYISIMALSFIIIPEFYLTWFRNDSDPALWAAVSELTPQLLMVVAVFTILDSVYLNISFALKGAGDTRFVSLIALLVPWPVMVLPTYLLRSQENAALLSWYCAACYSASITSILFLRFRAGKWKSMRVIS